MLIPEKLRETIEVILKEAPLPDEWDKDIFNEHVPFKRRIEYAKSMATRLGDGSSRVAFEIPYQDRKTVLKVAKNKKGIAQNQEEAKILSDSRIKNQFSKWFIPMIDYDQENFSGPTWIHVEYAYPIKNNKHFRSFLDFDEMTIGDFVDYVFHTIEPTPDSRAFIINFKDRFAWLHPEQKKRANELIEILRMLDVDLNVNLLDLTSKSNWGIYNHHPVMIDVGLTSEVFKKYYDIS